MSWCKTTITHFNATNDAYSILGKTSPDWSHHPIGQLTLDLWDVVRSLMSCLACENHRTLILSSIIIWHELIIIYCNLKSILCSF